MPKVICLILTVLFTLFIMSGNLVASDQKAKKINEPVTVARAKIINVEKDSGIIELLKDVVVERADTSFLANKMLVYYDENESRQSALQKIMAYDNVKVFNQEFVVTGNRGSYDPDSGNFTVTDNVVFNSGTSVASGHSFVYSIKTGKGYLEKEQENDEKNTKDRRVILIIDNEDLERQKPQNQSN